MCMKTRLVTLFCIFFFYRPSAQTLPDSINKKIQKVLFEQFQKTNLPSIQKTQDRFGIFTFKVKNNKVEKAHLYWLREKKVDSIALSFSFVTQLQSFLQTHKPVTKANAVTISIPFLLKYILSNEDYRQVGYSKDVVEYITLLISKVTNRTSNHQLLSLITVYQEESVQ